MRRPSNAFAAHSTAELPSKLVSIGAPSGEAKNVTVFESTRTRSQGPKAAGAVLRTLRKRTPAPAHAPPLLGQHTDAVLVWLSTNGKDGTRR